MVNDGKVVSVLTQDGKPRKIAPTLNLLITDHFKSILQYIKRDNLKLKVEYDKTLGYPSLIKTWSPGVFDSGSIIRISNVETDNVFNHKMSVGLDKGDLGSD